jgi:hypothetical protein
VVSFVCEFLLLRHGSLGFFCVYELCDMVVLVSI